MKRVRRPHLLGVDDGAFEKRSPEPVPVVGVVMEGCDLVEGVAITRFPVDGDGATRFLAEWIGGLRFRAGLQGVLLGGVTLAGLGVVDLRELAERLALPVVAVNRRDPTRHRLAEAFRAAGFPERLEVVERGPAPVRAAGLYLACAGTDPAHAAALVEAARRKSDLPEPLRLAHLIARAVATGESRGRP